MKKILVAHDGSKFAQKALRKGMEIANQFNGSLVVLAVIPELRITELTPFDQARLTEALEQQARKNLAKAEKQLKKKAVPARTLVRQGNAAEVILETARKVRAGLIVVGSHGRHGVEKYLLGSVSGKIVEHADRPVLVVK
jgi:nucleotide-binding universal stress UspA family protein